MSVQLIFIIALTYIGDYKQILKENGYHPVKLKRSPHNLIILDASINKFKPELFLLDSGSLILLSLDYIKKQNLSLVGPIAITKGTDGGDMKIYKTSIAEINVGTSILKPKFAMVTDFKHIQKGVAAPLAGVIGIDWMKAQHAIIDIANDTVYLSSM